jgi:choline oxidase
LTQTYDYLVLGGGTAGAIVARRLAEDPSATVCLVEAGPADEGEDRVRTLQRWPEMLQSEYDWDYPTEPQPQANSDIRASRARILGGCSAHNVCLAYRAPDVDLGRWESLGAEGWRSDACRPFYDRVFERTGLEWSPQIGRTVRDFIASARAIGFEPFRAMADGNVPGVGPTSLNARWPSRRSSAIAYLHPLHELPPNLTLALETRSRRLLLDGSRVRGVQTSRGELHASREVIVSQGVFESPKLLLLSGIGPADELREFGIDVVKDLPVGRRLVDHPEGAIAWRTGRPIDQPETSWCDAVLLGNPPGSDAVDPEIMLWFFSGEFGEFTTDAGGPPTTTTTLTLAPDVTRPRSTGWVRLGSADPDDPPRIFYGHFTDDDGYDVRVMVEAFRLARRIVAEEPLAGWIAEELAPGADVTNEEDLEAYARRSTYTAHHPLGTCPIGTAGDGRSVVDPELRVHGIEGLRVADASVFPDMIGVNPAITTMMIGERCAAFVRDVAATLTTAPAARRDEDG